ncbi:vacuole effluxer Atg22-like protein [Roseovarius mucosus]|uniref:Vacuole effluxer Atg22-like protein n=1 Tax=Roseovarius mucosus TaxID=215743 RepID=A0A1V0RNV4_9RHOB|nr:MFS transporter [Roseovarius mucosus]ARE83315.1 vacuole effluxer Atg22-like protein [Roseovarius mucosus]
MTGVSPRKRIWGWYFFDWASQPYHTLLVTFIFGPYFASVASEYFIGTGLPEEVADAQAQAMWSWCLTATGLIIGLGAPFMGAFADTTGRRLPWIIVFSMIYVIGATAIWGMLPDGSNLWWGLIAFGFGFVGAEYALIFINSQLPSLGKPEEVGDISGSGFAFGYLGGVLSLLIVLALFVEQGSGKTLIGLDPILGLDATLREGTRAVGPFTALWFVVFMVPYFLWVRDTGPRGHGGGVAVALGTLMKTINSLRHRLSLSTYLGSSMFYRDALNGLYGFGGTYAILVLNWSITSVGVFGIIGAIAGAVFSWLGGKADKRFGPKPVIKVAIWALIGVCVIVVGMDRSQIFGVPLAEGSTLPDMIFFGCGVLIGGFGGVLQASSRSLMVRHTDPALPTENFGLYGLSGRATAFMAPALIGLVTTLSGSARIGVSPVILLFVIGLVLLRWVKAEGDKETWVGS